MPFEEFYRQNFKTVYGFLINLCKNSDLAEELTAETFLKTFEHYKSYNKKYKPSTWLCAIAKNEYLKYLRKQKKIDGFDNAEIAEIFGKKETWVRVTYYRAKVRLLERLGDDNE